MGKSNYDPPVFTGVVVAKEKQQKRGARIARKTVPGREDVNEVAPKAKREAAPVNHPGVVLHALRKRNGWTLTDVCKRTGLQVSTLSKLENGKISFSYDRLIQVSNGLGIDMAQLVTGDIGPAPPSDVAPKLEAPSHRRSVWRKGEGAVVKAPTYVTRHLATDLLSKQFEPMTGEHHARSLQEFGPWSRHPGEEFVYVIEGVLELHTEHYAPMRLEAGDSMYFDSEMGHAYIAVGTQPCRTLCICAERKR